MTVVQGQPGELIDLLIELLSSKAFGEDEWSNVSFYVDYFIGGEALRNVIPDTGPPVPGSVGEMTRQQKEVVSREQYFGLIRDRLGELVASGLEEAFLVRSVRDAVRKELDFLADTGTGNRNREKMRKFIEDRASDPARIAEFRVMLAEEDPSVATLSDNEIATRMRNMTRLLQPISADEASRHWTLLTHWDQQAAEVLPDAAFDEWRQRRLRR